MALNGAVIADKGLATELLSDHGVLFVSGKLGGDRCGRKLPPSEPVEKPARHFDGEDACGIAPADMAGAFLESAEIPRLGMMSGSPHFHDDDEPIFNMTRI